MKLHLSSSGLGDRPEEYWSWVVSALFLLTTVDLLTTVFATAEFGVAAEANPLVRRALARGPLALAAVNVAAVVAASLLFALLLRLVRWSDGDPGRALSLAVETWLGLLVAAGLFVFANNLSVIVLGRSLVAAAPL